MKRSLNLLSCAIVVLSVTTGVRAETIDERIDATLPKLGGNKRAEAVKQLDAIAAELQARIEKTPQDAPAHYQLGRIHFYLDRDEKAAASFDMAMEIAPKEAQYPFMRGVVAKYMQDPAKAVAMFTKASELDPTRVDTWTELGEVLAAIGHDDRAMAAFKNALKLDASASRALSGLADIHLSARRYREAIPLLEKVAERDPDNFLAQYNVGQTYQNLKQPEKALAAFQRALAIDKNDWRTHAKVIQSLEALGKSKERDTARDTLLKLYKKHPDKIDSAFYCRDQFEVGDNKVMVFEYFAFEGEERVRYSFNVRSKKGQSLYRVSLGSYDSTHELAVAKKLVTKNQRYCHLDRYWPDGTHETFDFFAGEPTYDKTKSLVLKVIKGEVKASSSMTPNP